MELNKIEMIGIDCQISPSLQEFIFDFIEGIFRHSPSYGLWVFDLDQHPLLETFGQVCLLNLPDRLIFPGSAHLLHLYNN